jgi:hypothetical protein
MRLTKLRFALMPLLLAGAVSVSVLGAPGSGAATISPAAQRASVQPGPVTPVLAASNETASPADSSGKRCYSAYVLLDWKNALHKTTYTTWLGIDWCARHERVISSRIYTRGGETKTPLWSYNGRKGKGKRNTGSQIRVYSEVEFSFGIGPWQTHEFPCTQIRGTRTGHWSWRGTCNLS